MLIVVVIATVVSFIVGGASAIQMSDVLSACIPRPPVGSFWYYVVPKTHYCPESAIVVPQIVEAPIQVNDVVLEVHNAGGLVVDSASSPNEPVMCKVSSYCIVVGYDTVAEKLETVYHVSIKGTTPDNRSYVVHTAELFFYTNEAQVMERMKQLFPFGSSIPCRPVVDNAI